MKKNKLSFFMLFFFTFLFSCKKEHTATTIALANSYSYLSITNAAVGADNLDFYLDQSAVGLPDSLYYGNTVLFPANNSLNTTKTPYTYIPSGFKEIGFKKPGSDYFQVFFNSYFESGIRYSVFVIDTINHGQFKYVLLRDDIDKLDSSKSQLRFINLSPDAPAMDIWVYPNAGNKGYLLFSSRSYPVYDFSSLQESQKFKTMDAGPYYFVATIAGTLNIILEGGLIVPGKSAVTLYAKGLQSGTGMNQLDVGVIEFIQ